MENIEAQHEQTEFGIQRIYLKGLSFESPKTPQVFMEEWKPHLEMDIGTKTVELGDSFHDVVLTVTATVKVNNETVFLVEAQQAGIFSLKNFPKEQLKLALGSFCPNVLYPYVREVITDVVVRGGFPQLYIAPVNFDALYQQHHVAQQAEQIAH